MWGNSASEQQLNVASQAKPLSNAAPSRFKMHPAASQGLAKLQFGAPSVSKKRNAGFGSAARRSFKAAKGVLIGVPPLGLTLFKRYMSGCRANPGSSVPAPSPARTSNTSLPAAHVFSVDGDGNTAAPKFALVCTPRSMVDMARNADS